MKCEWRNLEEVAIEIIDGDRGKNYPSGKDFSSNGYCLFLNTKNVTKDGFLFEEKMFITEEKDNLLRKGKLQPHDVVMTTRGTVGNVAYYNSSIPYKNVRINSGMVIIRANVRDFNPEYVYWVFRSHIIQNQIIQYRSGTAQPQLPISSMKKMQIPVMSLNKQFQVVAVLSSLQKKIELNDKINANLQQQAQAIFKSWFVDFEPFQEGEFVKSELGPIPKGWRVGTISDLGSVVGGATPSKSKPEYYTSNGIAWITPKDLAVNKNVFISHGATDITQEGLKNSSVRIMPKGTVLFSSRAPIGYMAIANDKVTTNQGFKSVVPHENIGTAYVYCFLKYNLPMIDSLGSGSTFKEVSGATMKSVLALVPDDNTLRKFTNVCDSMFEKQECLERENSALINVRDALLPKLMNGEIAF